MENSHKAVPLSVIQVILIIGSMIVTIAVTWGINSSRLDNVETRVTRLEQRDNQIDRIEYNLRRLMEKNGLVYHESFGVTK